MAEQRLAFNSGKAKLDAQYDESNVGQTKVKAALAGMARLRIHAQSKPQLPCAARGYGKK